MLLRPFNIFQTTNILDLDTLKWSVGPEVPTHYERNAWQFSAVQFQNTVLIVDSRIHELNAAGDQWVERPEVPYFPPVNGVIDVSSLQ